jgi:hypothetical protein
MLYISQVYPAIFRAVNPADRAVNPADRALVSVVVATFVLLHAV